MSKASPHKSWRSTVQVLGSWGNLQRGEWACGLGLMARLWYWPCRELEFPSLWSQEPLYQCLLTCSPLHSVLNSLNFFLARDYIFAFLLSETVLFFLNYASFLLLQCSGSCPLQSMDKRSMITDGVFYSLLLTPNRLIPLELGLRRRHHGIYGELTSLRLGLLPKDHSQSSVGSPPELPAILP